MTFHDAHLSLESYHCQHCGCIFKGPKTYQSMEAQKRRYDLHQNDAEDEGYRAYFGRFLDFVLPYVKTPKRALDFGCGRSTLLAALLAKEGIGCEVYDPIYHPDTDYYSKKYQLIVSTEVFEHLHDPSAVFEMLVHHLEEGGYLAIQTAFVPGSIERYLDWYYRQDPTHIVFFSLDAFEVLAGKFGCRVLADNAKNILVIQRG